MDQIVSIISDREVDTTPREQKMSTKEDTTPSPPPMPRGPKPSVPAPEEKKQQPEEGNKAEESKPEPDYGIFADLPPRYASHRLAFIARDPDWAFAYWDVDDRRAPELFESGVQAVLRLIDANDGHVLESPKVEPLQGRYYFRLPAADQRYVVALYAVRGDMEHEVLRSNVVLGPPKMPRPAREPRFVALRAQRAVLEDSANVESPTPLVCEDARRAASYPTPSVAGQSLTLLPRHEKPRAAPVEDPPRSKPGQIDPTTQQIVTNVRAVLSGSEAVYLSDLRPLSSAELLKK